MIHYVRFKELLTEILQSPPIDMLCDIPVEEGMAAVAVAVAVVVISIPDMWSWSIFGFVICVSFRVVSVSFRVVCVMEVRVREDAYKSDKKNCCDHVYVP